MQQKSALKYYIGGLIIVIVIVVVIAMSHGSTPSTPQVQTTPVGTAAVATSTTPVATTSSATPATTPTQASGLVGTWGSAVAGKGVQGSGKVTISGTSYELSLDGDVHLVIQKVTDNAAVGTISYSNLCITTIVSAPGKTPVTKPAQCVSSKAVPAPIKINGSTLTFVGKSELGSDISFSGNFANDSITGSFTRSSQYGKITGSFNLVRAQN